MLGQARCQALLENLEGATTILEMFGAEDAVDAYWKGRAERLSNLLKRHAGAPEGAYGLTEMPASPVMIPNDANASLKMLAEAVTATNAAAETLPAE